MRLASRVAAAAIVVSACGGPPKIVLSRGTTPPSFLRRASLAEVVGYYGRSDESDTLQGTATLMDYAYLRAFAFQQGRARFDSDEEIEREAQASYVRWGKGRTSFAVRISIQTDLAFQATDPVLDLRSWSFRVRDGRGKTLRQEGVDSLSPQGRTEVESVPTWGGAIAYARHSYDLQGAVRFAYVLKRSAGWVSLYAYPPGIDEEPLTFVWLLR